MNLDICVEGVIASTPVAAEMNIEIDTNSSEMKRKRSGSPLLSNIPTKFRQTDAIELPHICLDDMCDEVLFEILKNLDTWALLSLEICNIHFQALTMDHRLWNCIDLSQAPLPLGYLEEVIQHANQKTKILKLNGNPFKEHQNCEVESFNQTLSQVLIIKCPNLTVLELNSVTLDFRILFIKDLPSTLKRLVFSNCSQHECNNMNTFSGMDTYLLNLEEFLSEYNDWFKPYYIMAISKLPKLRKLSLRGCIQIQSFVPYGSLAARLGFKTLEHLDLRRTPINDSDLQCFNALGKLKVLLLEQPDDLLTEETALKTKIPKGSTRLNSLSTENVAVSLRKDYERRMESGESKLKKFNSKNNSSVLDESTEDANSTSNESNNGDKVLPFPPKNPRGPHANIESSASTSSTNKNSETPVDHNINPNNEVDADNQPSTSTNCTVTLNVNKMNAKKHLLLNNDDDDNETDTDSSSDDDDDDEDDDNVEQLNDKEQPSSSSESREINKNLSGEKKSSNSKSADNSNLNNEGERHNVGSANRARTRSTTYRVNIPHEALRDPNDARDMVVVQVMERLHQQQQQLAGERASRRIDNFNNINNMMFHPLFWCMLNPGRPLEAPAPNLPAEVPQGQRANRPPQLISIELHALINADGNGRQAFANNFIAGNGPALRNHNRTSNYQHIPDRGYVSDRGVCSFGRPRNQADRGIIWIRIDARPVDNSLEHIILRNYKAISDTTLRHLVQCSPNLIYLDVTGTSITLDGIRAFSAQKPTCNVVAHHLRGVSDIMLHPDPIIHF